jgi:hypothetical protein
MIRDLFRTDLCSIPYTPAQCALFFLGCLVVCAIVERLASTEDDE